MFHIAIKLTVFRRHSLQSKQYLIWFDKYQSSDILRRPHKLGPSSTLSATQIWPIFHSFFNVIYLIGRLGKFYGLLRISEFTKLPPIQGLWEKVSPRLAIMWLHGTGLTGLSSGFTIKCPAAPGSSWIQSRQFPVFCGFADAILVFFGYRKFLKDRKNLLHPRILKVIVLYAPADLEAQSSLL
jgi:hypothetical protein